MSQSFFSYLSKIRYLSSKYFCNQCLINVHILFKPQLIQRKSMSTKSKYNWSISLICPSGNHEPIELLHQEAIFLGRCPSTRIVDPRCSRKQVKLFCDLNTGDIQVTQTGSNSSALDGIEMIKDKVYTMKHSSTLHILAGLFPQKVLAKSLAESTNHEKKNPSTRKTDNYNVIDQGKLSSKNSSKRKISEDSSSGHSSKKAKVEEKGKEKSESKSKSSAKSTDSSKNAKRATENGVSEERKKSLKNESGHKTVDNDSDSQYLKDVADKLNKLKSSAKDMKTPVKPHKPPSVTTDGEITTTSSDTGPAPSSRWDHHDSLYLFTSKGVVGRNKIAGFDIDGTIIETQSGKKFPTHPGDWRMKFNNSVVKKIRTHYEEGYKIVFFTNQMGVSRGKTNMSDLKAKFADVLEEINVPIQIFVSTKSGLYRKPCIGMWNFLVDKGNNGVSIDLSQSFYVGDAAGRQDNWAAKKKKDFSCSDRLFALNIGLEFHTPEEFFLGYPTCNKFQLPQFDPRKVSSKTPLLDPPDADLASVDKEIIVMSGCPASGKSFFSKKYLVSKGYTHVNRDTLGTWQKCVTACKESIKKGNSVVVDNTNPDQESRARYLKVASSAGIPCRCFVMSTTLDQAKHNERFREITDKSHEPINDIIMNSFKMSYKIKAINNEQGKFKPPELSEGFTEIVKVNFVPKFKDEKQAELYKMFLMER